MKRKEKGYFFPKVFFAAIFLSVIIPINCIAQQNNATNGTIINATGTGNVINVGVLPSSKEKELNYLRSQTVNLKKQVNDLKGQKFGLGVIDTTINGVSGKLYRAKAVSGNNSESLFIPDTKCPDCPPLPPKDPCLSKVCLDSLRFENIAVSLIKVYPEKDPLELVQTKLSLKDFVSGPAPTLDYKNTYTEYLSNPYRKKAENSFWWAVGLGGGSAILYGASELMGHPTFYLDRDEDESSAKTKHDVIFGLRTGSAVLAGLSLVQFGRTIYFHKMEGKFIIQGTTLGLTINLDKKK